MWNVFEPSKKKLYKLKQFINHPITYLVKKGDTMEEREFAKYAFLIVAVVAVVGLLTMGDGITGFASKKSIKINPAAYKMKTPAKSGSSGSGVPVPTYQQPAAAPAPTRRAAGGCSETDGGNVSAVNGTITYFNATSGQTETRGDSLCYGTTLWEFYCTDGRLNVSANTCQPGTCRVDWSQTIGGTPLGSCDV